MGHNFEQISVHNATGLPDDLKAGIERLSGVAIDDVKVHYNSAVPASYQALAFAQGSNIHVGPGQERHLPHEAWHVVQQKLGRVQPTLQLRGAAFNADSALEREADMMGAKATHSTKMAGSSATPAVHISTTTLEARSTGSNVIQAVFNYQANGIEFLPWTYSRTNAIGSTRAAGEPRGDFAYIATVPTPGSGKDKGPLAIANQYRDEGFADHADAQARFALMVAVNQCDSVVRTQDDNEQQVQAQVNQVDGFNGFRMGAIGFLWRVRWRTAAGGDVAPDGLPQVRADAQTDQETATTREKEANKEGLINYARNKVMGYEGTTNAITHLRDRFTNVYIHVGDPDAVNLRANATAAAAPSPLFPRYDTVLAERNRPQLATGGYYFREEDGAVEPHQGGAATAGAQAVATNRLDMRVRTAIAAQNARMPYFPEPNLVIRSDLRTEANQNAIFGVAGPEYDRLLETLNPAAAEMVFDTRAAIYTDAGRFDTDVTAHGTQGAAHTAGMTSREALFDPQRAKQSHAKREQLISRMRKVYDNPDLINPALKVMLPQEALGYKTDRSHTTAAAIAPRLNAFVAAIPVIQQYVIDMQAAAAPPANWPAVRAALRLRGINNVLLQKDFCKNIRELIIAVRANPASRNEIFAAARAAGDAVVAFLREFNPMAAAGH